MFKFAVLCVILWHGVREISGAPPVLTDTPTPTFPSIHSPKINDSDQNIELNGNHNFHATQQIFYLGGPLIGGLGASTTLKNVGRELNSDYLMTNGIGAHKLHRRKLSWNKARQICQQEGGHLAVIKSESEEKIVLQMMLEYLIDDAWLGFHDKFEEGDWISVLDEPLAETGWARWSKEFKPNPDNYQGKQHCARIVRKGGGMDDDNCDLVKSFVCKISTY